MVREVEDAFSANFNELAWMDSTTLARAQDKLAKITNKIGYPDRWRSFEDVVMKKGKYFENQLELSNIAIGRMLEKIGKPVDKNQWYVDTIYLSIYLRYPFALIIDSLINGYYLGT